MSYTLETRCVELSADNVGQPETDIVEQHDEDVGCIRVEAGCLLTAMVGDSARMYPVALSEGVGGRGGTAPFGE